MTDDKDFKRIVRMRMVETGERYTAARAALRGPSPSPEPSDRVREWVAELGIAGRVYPAYHLLKALPPEELRAAVLRGIDDANWRIRRQCCRLLDDLALSEETTAALERRLDDEHPEVRRAALHTLSCEHCKPDGCSLDIRGVFERMATDRNARVRKTVVGPLSYKYDEPWALELLRRFAANDPSTELRALAEQGIARIDGQRRTDEARRTLPEELRRKTERHKGKWVAIVDGTIVEASWSPGTIRKALRGLKLTDAAVYWVAPSPG